MSNDLCWNNLEEVTAADKEILDAIREVVMPLANSPGPWFSKHGKAIFDSMLGDVEADEHTGG